MHHFGFEEIINDKKRKVNTVTKEGWKYHSTSSHKTTWFDKLRKKRTTPVKPVKNHTQAHRTSC